MGLFWGSRGFMRVAPPGIRSGEEGGSVPEGLGVPVWVRRGPVAKAGRERESGKAQLLR